MNFPEDWPNIAKKHGLPPTPGPVLDARWVMGHDDWWVKTDAGWYWLRPGTRIWMKAPLGPPGENP